MEMAGQSMQMTIGHVVIGRGPFTLVCEGKLNGIVVAVKRMDPLRRTELAQTFLQGGCLLKQLSHPHILKIFEVYESKEDGPIIVMEKLDQNLEDHLHRYAGKLSRKRQIAMCLQIADAVHYLHSQQPPVVYREVSSLRVLLSEQGILKLGTSMTVARLPPSGYFDDSNLEVYVHPRAVLYMPFEALMENAHYNEEIDIFSLGVLMLEIAIQQRPSCGLSGIGTVPEIDHHGNDLSLLLEDHPLKPVILQCLRDDPRERPDSGTVLRMLKEGETLIWCSAVIFPQL